MIAGGMDKLVERPFISFISCFAISPLKLCTQSTRIMQEANRCSVPIALSSAPMAGSTSPLTMAGTLATLIWNFEQEEKLDKMIELCIVNNEN